MAGKRHKPEEIVSKLRQVDVLLGQGKSRSDAIFLIDIPHPRKGVASG
jgi:putative transposase